MRDLSPTIARLGGDRFTVVRRRAGIFERGRYVKDLSAPETFEAVGSIQPLNGRELQFLPEGEKDREVRKLYTTTALKIDEDEPDHVVYLGVEYEVTVDTDWKPQANYFRYKLVKAEK